MSVQPQMMRLFFNRNSSQGGLPSDYSGDAPGSKWLLRKKGVQLSSCVPMVDNATPELGTKVGIATDGISEAVLSTVVRAGRLKFDLDISKKHSNGVEYIRAASPDLSVILNDSFAYTIGCVGYDPIANEFVTLVRRGFNHWYLLRINATTYEIVPGGDDPVSGIMFLVTRSAPLAATFAFPNAPNPGSGGFLVKNGACYFVNGFGNIRPDLAVVNITTRQATLVPYSHPGSGYFSMIFTHESTSGSDTGLGMIFGPNNADQRYYLVDPTAASITHFTIPRSALSGAASWVFNVGQGTPTYLNTVDGRKLYVRTYIVQAVGGPFQVFVVVMDETGYVNKVQWTGSGSQIPQLFAVKGTNTFYGVRIQASQYHITKFSFDPATNAVSVVSQTTTPYTAPAVSNSVANVRCFNSTNGYFVDVNKNTTRKPILWSPADGKPITTISVAGTIGNVTGLVAQTDLALDAAYPAMYIPEEGSELEPVACTALVSKFVGGKFDSALPDRNFLVNFAKDETTNGEAKGQSRVASVVNVELMNTSCVLSGPGHILNIESLDQD